MIRIKKIFACITYTVLFLLTPSVVFAQKPAANFSADKTSGCGTLVVKFTDLSSNSPTSWLWNFGNGNTSTLKNPTAFYAAPGTYTVTLTATNGSGSGTITKTAYITVYKEPTPLFTANDTAGCAPFNVSFSDLSLPGDKPITTWLWDFGDGTNSITKNPSHTFAAPGVYQISLSVTDGNGCFKKLVKTTYISVDVVPDANFTAAPTASCSAPVAVTFTNSSTPGSGVIYSWDFGDGSPLDTAKNPSHIFSAAGSYTVKLIVTSPNGCVDSITRTNYITIAPFQADFGAVPYSGCEPLTVAFSDSSTTGVTVWNWNFGDSKTSTAKNPTNTYSAPGTYTVTLISSNPGGCKDTITKTIIVHPFPKANFTLNDSTACAAPFTVNFTDLTGGGAFWDWNFGDLQTSLSQNPSHTYTAPGLYTVRLIVTDTNGCKDTLNYLQRVQIVEPRAGFTAIPQKGCVPLTVQFTDTSFSNETKTGWFWDFGDGFTSTLQNPVHTYTDTGEYTITLVITNIEGCKDTVIRVKYVLVGIKPVVKFGTLDTLGCHPYPVQFTDSSSLYTDEWFWFFGDGGTSTTQHPNHTYADTGFFTVTLIAGHNGCYDTLIKPNYIYVLPPKPIFTGTPVIGCYFPHTVTFTDQSKGAETWLWDFGDGTTFNGQSPPPHVYANPGFYTVKLVVTNSNGCKDSLIIPNYIRISDIKPGYVQSKTVGCQPLSVTYTDTSYTNTGVVNWFWDFGDGYTLSGSGLIPAGTHGGLTTGTFAVPTHTYQNPDSVTVILVVTDQLGCKDTVAKQTLVVKQLPTPKFAAVDTSDCAPFTVQFNDSSLATPPAAIVKWVWTYGDGSPADSSSANPTHTYLLRGAYTVKLTITDDQGCINSITKTGYINPTFPYPNFTMNAIACAYDSVQFTDSSTPAGGTFTYLWKFGDGDSSILKNPKHSFKVDTTTIFNVTLTVTDQNGCDSTIIKPITISKPQANFGVKGTLTDCPPFFVNFFDSSTTDTDTWLWILGDGGSITDTLKRDSTSYVYNSPGKYTVRLIITNYDGCTDTLTRDSLITVGGPTGTFTFTPTSSLCAPLKVTFKATASGNTELYRWVFGDGSDTLAGDSVVHFYTSTGVFKPVLLIYDSLDAAIGDTVRCEMKIIPPDSIVISGPNVDFLSSVDTTCAGKNVTFVNSTVPIPPNTKWAWDFGDGTPVDSSLNPTHSYTTPGNYTITLWMIIDSCKFEMKKTAFITVFDPPVMNITISDTSGCEPLTVIFTVDSSSITYPLNSWLWSFGDGGIDTSMSPTHTFTTDGVYNVVLTVSYANGCTGNYPVSNITVYPSPTADFEYISDFDGIRITGLNFTNKSSNAVIYWWDFGDGSSSTLKDPSHTYLNEGLYTIMLVAANSYGCTDTAIKKDSIYFKIVIPNIFTPNGDPTNEFFDLKIPGEFRNFRIIIYDRWGLLVYKNDDYQNNWNGMNMKGEPVNDDTYFYILTYYDRYSWNGWVRVLRGDK